MAAHAIAIDSDIRTAIDNHGATYQTAASRYRWRCSCGRVGGWTLSRVRAARNGGARHVAAMERGR